MYYIMKTCVCDHGVMWIGEDLEEGKAKADYFASNNDDGHHYYEVRRHKEATPHICTNMPDWNDESECVHTGINTTLSQP